MTSLVPAGKWPCNVKILVELVEYVRWSCVDGRLDPLAKGEGDAGVVDSIA